MLKSQIKLTKSNAEAAFLCYQSIAAAREYARSISIDPNCPYQVQIDFRYIAASLTAPLERIDKRIPKQNWEVFQTQVKNNDALRLENIKSLYTQMIPAQQEMAELLMMGILKGEVILDCTENKKVA